MYQVVERNPIVFLQKVAEGFGQGWKLSDKSEGFPSQYPLYQINLYKGREFTTEVVPDTRQQAVVSEYNVMDFLRGVYNAVANGFELDVDSISWDSIGKKVCVLNNPNYIEVKQYSKKELEDMDWNSLKKTGRMYGHGGRDRNLLINRILESQKEK